MTDDTTAEAVLTPEEVAELRKRNAAAAEKLEQNQLRYLAEIRTELKRVFPDALKFLVSSSDQGHYGYWLYWVMDKHQGKFEGGDARFDELEESITDALGDLSWGRFGDSNADSMFEVDAETLRIIRD